jgi:hypothetical protein
MDDAAHPERLLRAFEPVVRFTKGEYFFPVSVERYVAAAALWGDDAGAEARIIAPPGSLDLAALVQHAAPAEGLGQSLSGIVDGSSRAAVIVPPGDHPPRLRGGSRLAAVGLLARLVDALNRLSLLFRGTLPGGSAARALLVQRDRLAPDEPTYYGRVVRDGHWIICQYWYFYAFNNWRSGFGGVNEHEADWEQVTVYLDGAGEPDDEGLPRPCWVVFSAHDETGDDLRRRWDDPDLHLVESRHPVVYAGAGSHSGAYLPGDYLITVPTPTLRGVVKLFRQVGRIIAPWSPSANSDDIGIPYVDYARGDGRVIGAGGDPWRPVVVDDETPWLRGFRGLWGHDTKDRLGGERGPAGPRYNRDGTVRQSWGDPVGWAGLAKVAPNPAVEADLLEARESGIRQRLAELETEVSSGRRDLQRAAAGLPPSAPQVRGLEAEEERVLALRMEEVALRDELDSIELAASSAVADPGPHAHLRHRRLPLTPLHGFRNTLLSGWSVVSSPIILLAAAAIISPQVGQSVTENTLVWLLLLLAIEGLLRGQFLAVLGRLAVVGVTITAVLGLVYLADWRTVLALLFSVGGLLLLVVNLRDALKR